MTYPAKMMNRRSRNTTTGSNVTSLSYVNMQLREIKTWITRLVNDIFSCGKKHNVSLINILMVEEYEEISIFLEYLFIIVGV